MILVVLIRMCRRTAARIELTNRAALRNIPLSEYITQHSDKIVHEARKYDISYEDLLQPILPPSTSYSSPLINSYASSPSPTVPESPLPSSNTSSTSGAIPRTSRSDLDDDFNGWMTTNQNYCRDYKELLRCLDAMSLTGHCKDRSRRIALQNFRDDPSWKSLIMDGGSANIEKAIIELDNTLDNKRGCRGGKRSKKGREREGVRSAKNKSQKRNARKRKHATK